MTRPSALLRLRRRRLILIAVAAVPVGVDFAAAALVAVTAGADGAHARAILSAMLSATDRATAAGSPAVLITIAPAWKFTSRWHAQEQRHEQQPSGVVWLAAADGTSAGGPISEPSSEPR